MKNIIDKILNIKTSKTSGFTLVEVLIATALFSIAVTGIITVSFQGGANIGNAKNRLIANYLAQEGVEITRAKRDSYVLSNSTSYSDGWDAFTAMISANCTGPCDLDVGNISNLGPTGNSYLSCLSGGDTASPCLLLYNPDGFYIHGTVGTKTPFTRELTFTPYYAPGSTTQIVELEITSTVTWMEGSKRQSVSVNESLFDWYASI
jgi:prepilin-type N-terminal cleavage/methylation domain-containing protein